MSFGAAVVPRVFSRILSEVCGSYHIMCSILIDDKMIMNVKKSALKAEMEVISSLITKFGYTINR